MSDNPKDTGDGRVTLALLRNDLLHLTAAVGGLRSDMQKNALDWSAWRTEHEKVQKELSADVVKLNSQMTIIKWAFGVVTSVVLALAVASAKGALGL